MSHTPDAYRNIHEDIEWARCLANEMVGDVDLAEDILQQSLVVGIEKPPSAEHSNKRLWLGQVLRNSMRMHFRTQGRAAKRERKVARNPLCSDDPSALVQRKEVASVIRSTLDSLSEPYRTTLMLRYWEERSLTDIATTFGVPVRTIESRLRRGRELMRQELSFGGRGSAENWLSCLAPLFTLKRKRSKIDNKFSSFGRFPLGVVVAMGLFLTVMGLLFLPSGSRLQVRQNPTVAKASQVKETSLYESIIPNEFENRRIPLSASMGRIANTSIVKHDQISVKAFDDSNGRPIEGATLRVLFLKSPTNENLLKSQMSRVFREENSNLEWIILAEEKIVTNSKGKGVVQVRPNADRVVIAPGSWTSTHSLGCFQDYDRRSVVKKKESWPGLNAPFSLRENRVSGSVLDSMGCAIPGAEVHYWFGTNWKRSEQPDHVYPVHPDGSFAVNNLSSEDCGFTLVASAPRMKALWKYSGRMDVREPIEGLALEMTPDSPIQVLVRNGAGLPMPGIAISVNVGASSTPPKHPSGTFLAFPEPMGITDAGGSLTALGGKEFENVVTVTTPGREPNSFRLSVGQGRAEIQLDSDQVINGFVSDKLGQHLAGVQIEIPGGRKTYTTTTADDGSFRIVVPEMESVGRIRASRIDLGLAWSNGKEGIHHGMVKIGFSEVGTIHGEIKNFDPLEMGTLNCYPWEQVLDESILRKSWIPDSLIQLNNDGAFEISQIPVGEYLLVYRKPDGICWKVRAFQGETEVLMTGLTSDGFTGQLVVNPKLVGLGSYAEAVQVKLFQASDAFDLKSYYRIGSVLRMSDGIFRSKLLSAGDFVLCVWSRPHKRHSHYSVTVLSDSIVEMQPLVPRLLPLVINVEDESGLPIVGIEAFAIDSNGLPTPRIFNGRPVEKVRRVANRLGEVEFTSWPDRDDVDLLIRRMVGKEVLATFLISKKERQNGFVTVVVNRDR